MERLSMTARVALRGATALLVAGGGVALASCGSSSSPPATSSTTTTVSQTTKDLPITTAVVNALLAAGAASHTLPVSDYTGLTKGLTYYAYDPTDGLYWAGAQLVPSTKSMAAEVGAQDDGAYDLFTMPAGGTWKAFNDGLGTATGTNCAIVTPASVRLVWGWSLTTPCGGPPG
jgi:hypothetical protein